MMRNSIFVFTLLGAFSWASNTPSFDPASYSSDNVITRDVAIIGGGATGTYAAMNFLLKQRKSLVVVEKEAVLGGHTNTSVYT